MLPPDVMITRIQEDNRIDDAGKAVQVIRVEFKVGSHGPFVERFPKDTFDVDTRDATLSAFAMKVRTT